MNDIEARHQSLVLAQHYQKNSDIPDLLATADKLFRYMSGRKAKEEPTPSQAISFIEALMLPNPEHVDRGAMPFKLYEHQKKIVSYLEASDHVIINTARQMGVTKTLAAYALYAAMSTPDATVLWLTDSFQQVLAVFEYLRWTMRLSLLIVAGDNKSELQFDNGSRLIGRASSSHAGRGLTLSHVIVDNAAFISHAIFRETWPLIGASPKVVLASSPLDTDGVFHDIWMHGGCRWRKLLLPWYEHPLRDAKWLAQMSLPEPVFEQEYCCDFRRKT